MTKRREPRDEPGAQGERGRTGARGAKGVRGQRGLRGPAGSSASRADILAAVEDQFAEIQKQLTAQLTRTAQVQSELDRHHRELARLTDQLREVQAAIKQLMASA